LLKRCFGTETPEGACISAMVPTYSTTDAAQRSTAIPLEGMHRMTLINGLPYKRLVPSLWFPGYGNSDATWNTMWSPLSNGTVNSCGWGIGRLDVPVPGIDLNGDMHSDMVVYRPDEGSTAGQLPTGWFFFKNSTPLGGCGGNASSVYWQLWWTTARIRTLAVADMTGDGKSEILGLHPNDGTLRWLKSENNYAFSQVRDIGTQYAIFF
jgi:hypothetical protein